MKYLKKFNESVDIESLNTVLELKSFTEDCLAYLLDDGLDVEVHKAYRSNPYFKQEGYEISLFNSTREFSWRQIKDYYIPFIQLLSNRYDLVSTHSSIDTFVVKIAAHYSGYYYYTYDDIINDRIGVTKFNSIMVRVKEKQKS